MATLKEVKLRIQGIRSTQKITKAMKIVAATKRKKYEREQKESRLFSRQLKTMLTNTVQYSYHPEHRLMQSGASQGKVGVVIIASDRGLCGSFNSNLLRKTFEYLEGAVRKQGMVLVPLGRKAHDYFKKTGYKILFSEMNIEKRSRRECAEELTKRMIEEFFAGAISEWRVISNRFISRGSFGYTNNVLMPITVPSHGERTDSLYAFEDSVTDMLNYLLPVSISDLMYQYILESQLAEEFSRMLAMDYATENADELIGELTLHYNRTRQQVITREISEIVGGAEALK